MIGVELTGLWHDWLLSSFQMQHPMNINTIETHAFAMYFNTIVTHMLLLYINTVLYTCLHYTLTQYTCLCYIH